MTDDRRLRQYAFRLDPEIIARIDAHAERLTKSGAVAGVTFARVDALRNLLAVALAAAEAADPATPEPATTKPRKGR